jgi:hypothetical protein
MNIYTKHSYQDKVERLEGDENCQDSIVSWWKMMTKWQRMLMLSGYFEQIKTTNQ